MRWVLFLLTFILFVGLGIMDLFLFQPHLDPLHTGGQVDHDHYHKKGEEIYLVRIEGENPYTHGEQGKVVADAFGGQVGEFSELLNAFWDGAEWCYPGTIEDRDKVGGFYPMQKPTKECGLCSCHPEQCDGAEPKSGVTSGTPCVVHVGSGGLLIRGKKPPKGTTKVVGGKTWIVVPFSPTKWSRHD